MDTERAKEIAQSPIMQDVTYQGKQIYIQHVDVQQKLAHVHLLDDPEHDFHVSLSHLEESE